MSDGPFKMKYTNGKKSDMTAFPFKGESPQPGDSPVDFNWKAALGGAVQGGAAGSMVMPGWGTVLGGLAGGISAGIKGDKGEDSKNEELITKLEEEDQASEDVKQVIKNRRDYDNKETLV